MLPQQAWQLLGVAAGADSAAIKRAYAARLKAIDPERDVEAFLNLRAAFELARHLVEADAPEANFESGGADEPTMPVHQAPALDQASSQPVATDRASEAASSPPDEPAPDPRAPLAELLWGVSDPAAGSTERAALALLHDPAMANIDFASETELWLAHLAVETAPRCDTILPLLDAHFGWRRIEDMVRVDPAIAMVLQRMSDLAAAGRLESPMHRWHFFYMMLKQPAPEAIAPRDLTLYGADMGEMLDSLRFYNPELLRSLERRHVELWEDAITRLRFAPATPRVQGIGWFGWLMLGAMAVNFAALIT